jgi:hypothetical protein
MFLEKEKAGMTGSVILPERHKIPLLKYKIKLNIYVLGTPVWIRSTQKVRVQCQNFRVVRYCTTQT